MQGILEMVKNVSIFLLGTTVLIHIFGDTAYKKYMEYAVGLILIAMVVSLVFSFVGDGAGMEEWLGQSVSVQKAEETEEEIRILGEEYEAAIREKYREELCEDAAAQCGVRPENCKVVMEDNSIKKIVVRVPQGTVRPSEAVKKLAMRYGIEESWIYLMEE